MQCPVFARALFSDFREEVYFLGHPWHTLTTIRCVLTSSALTTYIVSTKYYTYIHCYKLTNTLLFCILKENWIVRNRKMRRVVVLYIVTHFKRNLRFLMFWHLIWWVSYFLAVKYKVVLGKWVALKIEIILKLLEWSS